MKRPLLAAALLALASGSASADRLHLESGGAIDVAEWWIEGSTLFYRTGAGTIGIPRASVLKIDPTAAPPEPAAAPAAAAPARKAPLAPADLRALEEAKQALERRDFTTAADLYREVLSRPGADADFHLPRVGYALSLIALDQDGVALGIVLDGLARDPHHPGLLELLGDLRNREERVHDAVRAWRSAFEREPSDRLRSKIEKAERELEAGRDYALETTSHFNLRFDGEVDEALSEAVHEHLERQFWVVGEALAHTPAQPITVLLYPRRQFQDVTGAGNEVGGLYDGKIRAPLGGLARLNPVAAGVLTHELTHAVIHSKTRGNCPRWLHEGLAQHFEGKTVSRAEGERLAAALAAGEPPAWEERGFSYPSALSLTAYLIEEEGGLHRIVDLLDELAAGSTLDAALSRIYGGDPAAVGRRWAESVLGRQEP